MRKMIKLASAVAQHSKRVHFHLTVTSLSRGTEQQTVSSTREQTKFGDLRTECWMSYWATTLERRLSAYCYFKRLLVVRNL